MLEEAADAAAYVIAPQVGKTGEIYSVVFCVVWVHRRAHLITVGFDAQSEAVITCLVYLIDLFGSLSLLVVAAHKLVVVIKKY